MAAHLVPMLEGQCAVRRGTLLEGAASAAPESADPEQAATNAAIKDIHRGCGYRLEILWRVFQTHANFPLDGITQMSCCRGSVTSRLDKADARSHQYAVTHARSSPLLCRAS